MGRDFGEEAGQMRIGHQPAIISWSAANRESPRYQASPSCFEDCIGVMPTHGLIYPTPPLPVEERIFARFCQRSNFVLVSPI